MEESWKMSSGGSGRRQQVVWAGSSDSFKTSCCHITSSPRSLRMASWGFTMTSRLKKRGLEPGLQMCLHSRLVSPESRQLLHNGAHAGVTLKDSGGQKSS